MANIARCVLDSADKTNLSRFFSEAPWQAERVNEKRIKYMLQQTAPLAHNLITSHYVSGAVRFPVDALLYCRYDELTDNEFY